MIIQEETKEDLLKGESMYTSLEEAKDEIIKRWQNKDLKDHVNAYLNFDIPLIFGNKPKAFLARHITSPNFEFFRFLNLATKINLDPVVLEYSEDILAANNPGKYFLCKIFFYDGKGKNGGKKLSNRKLVCLDEYQGEKISYIPEQKL